MSVRIIAYKYIYIGLVLNLPYHQYIYPVTLVQLSTVISLTGKLSPVSYMKYLLLSKNSKFLIFIRANRPDVDHTSSITYYYELMVALSTFILCYTSLARCHQTSQKGH